MEFSNYLKSSVGPLLARGLAEVVSSRPKDPVEALSMWLLHQLQLQELKKKYEDVEKAMAAERAKYEQLVKARQDDAAKKIQSEVRRRRAVVEENRRKEAEALAALEAQRKLEEEELAKHTVTVDEEGKSTEEVEAEKAKKKTELSFKKRQEDLLKLDKNKIEEFRRAPKPTDVPVKVFRAVLLLLDRPAPKLKDAKAVQASVKTADAFLKEVLAYDPTTMQKKKKFKLIDKELKGITSEIAKKASVALWLLYEWLVGAQEVRNKAVAERKAMKENGKEVEEEEEEADGEAEGEGEGEAADA